MARKRSGGMESQELVRESEPLARSLQPEPEVYDVPVSTDPHEPFGHGLGWRAPPARLWN